MTYKSKAERLKRGPGVIQAKLLADASGVVPQSMEECSRWVAAGGLVVHMSTGDPVGITAQGFLHGMTVTGFPSRFRLRAPAGLSLSLMDPDQWWTGRASSIPQGWLWRHRDDDGWRDSVRTPPTDGRIFVECRPPLEEILEYVFWHDAIGCHLPGDAGHIIGIKKIGESIAALCAGAPGWVDVPLVSNGTIAVRAREGSC